MFTNSRTIHYILGSRVDSFQASYIDECLDRWTKDQLARYVCISNVHMVMEGFDHPEYQRAVNNAALVTPDGMPLVWILKLMGKRQQQRISGPDLMPHIFAMANVRQWKIGLYGSTQATLDTVAKRATSEFPSLAIAYQYSPDFTEIGDEELMRHCDEIVQSGTQILFVALGCPKQEVWMHRAKPLLHGVTMFGVGAAFDFYSGQKMRAPKVFQDHGLEWLHRLLTEPKRLLRRYLKHNPRFLLYAYLEASRKVAMRRSPGALGDRTTH